MLKLGAPRLQERNEREMKAVADMREKEAGTGADRVTGFANSSHEKK